MRELRAIGAGDARNGAPARARRQVTSGAHDRGLRSAARADGVLSSTWEIITAMAWAPPAGVPRRDAAADIATFPADRIPLRQKNGVRGD